ncbi:MAG: ABC transporter substrate-binding protein [Planctomycetota bacterium]
MPMPEKLDTEPLPLSPTFHFSPKNIFPNFNHINQIRIHKNFFLKIFIPARRLLYIKSFWALLLLIILSGCGEQTAKPRTGGILKLSAPGGTPDNLNPVLTDYGLTVALWQLIFNNLVRINPDMTPQPDLAYLWQISPDGLAYTFYLRPNVRFHDGVELTSADIAFTYDLIKKYRTYATRHTLFDAINHWETPDKYTFKIILNKPFGLSLTTLSEPILPKHLLEGQDIINNSFNRSPVGSGPFRFKEWTPDNRITLEANPDYYEGRPHLDRIEAHGYDTPEQIWAALMKGETDLTFFLPREKFETAARDPYFKTYQFPYILVYALEYNLADPIVRDRAVRQALAHIINVPEIIQAIEGGYGEPATGPFIPDVWWYNPNPKPIPYNPIKAQELLVSAGWYPNENGVLEKDGREFRLNLLVNSDVREGYKMATLIHNNLLCLGIKTELLEFDYQKYLKGEIEVPEDASAYLTFFSLTAEPSDLAKIWHSAKRDPRIKLWPYHNLEVNRLFELGQTLTNLEERQKTYQQIHQLIYDDQPATFLYFFYNLCVMRDGFKNTDALFSAVMPFWTIKDWQAKTGDGK